MSDQGGYIPVSTPGMRWGPTHVWDTMRSLKKSRAANKRLKKSLQEFVTFVEYASSKSTFVALDPRVPLMLLEAKRALKSR